jgi:hypothetical protein
VKFRGVIPRAHFPRNFGGTIVTLVLTGRWGDRHPLIPSADSGSSGHFAGDCLASGDCKNSLDRGCIRGVDVVEPAANCPTGQCSRGLGDSQSIGWIDVGAECIEGVGLVGKQICLSHENRNEVSARDLVHRREEFETNPVPQQVEISVRGILEWCPTKVSTDLDGVRASQVKEWVANATGRAAHDTHADQSVESCPSQEIDDHRFGSVIGGVSGEDVCRQHPIARRAGSGLDIGSGFDMDTMSEKVGSDIVRRPGYCIGFVERVGSQTVIDVNGSDIEISGSSQSKEGE